MRAEEICARSEHCSVEIAEKLYKWGITQTDRQKIIETLTDRRFIDDERFAQAYAHDKAEYSGWGRIKIAASLRQKRIPQAYITQALEQIDESHYVNRLQNIIVSKRRTLNDPESYESRTKIFRLAAQRGFEPSLIAKFIDCEGFNC